MSLMASESVNRLLNEFPHIAAQNPAESPGPVFEDRQSHKRLLRAPLFVCQ
jgi:hypothetical protein